jgi:YHS domain-containing protein
MITVECDFCHSQFQKQRKILGISIKRGQQHLFCNQKCLHLFKSTKKEYLCSECQKPIFKSNSEINKSKNLFCSQTCSGKFNNRIRYKNHVYKNNKKEKIITKKIPKLLKLKHSRNCEQCNREIFRTDYQLSKSKNKLTFCSRSCRMTYQNLNNAKKYGCRKSKAETFLSNLIKFDFPNLVFTENDRTILPSKLEIDIFIKSKNLAIELNGPVHYFPIYGQERLDKCKNKDIQKQIEISQLGLNLLILDISRLNSKKKTEQFLIEYYQSTIKPILT